MQSSSRFDVVQVRMRKAHKELSKGNKVRLVIQFKGREMRSMIPIAEKLAHKLFEYVEEVGTWEVRPKVQGRQMVAFITPNKPQ
jgi:translation initiation factor IF-3